MTPGKAVMMSGTAVTTSALVSATPQTVRPLVCTTFLTTSTACDNIGVARRH